MPSVGTPAGFFYNRVLTITGTVQSSSRTVTATTNSSHEFIVGETITIGGSSVAAHNTSGTYPSFTVTSVPSSSTFTYLTGDPDAGSATGGAAEVRNLHTKFTPKISPGGNITFQEKTDSVRGDYLLVNATAQTGSITIQEEGSSLSTAATTLNFVGSTIAATGTGATKTITVSASAGNTLDSAYDQGGVGSGRTIAANNGAVAITVADGSNNNALDITQADDNNNKDGIRVNMEGTGAGLRIHGTSNDTAKIILENDQANQLLTLQCADDGVAAIAASSSLTIQSDAGEPIYLNPDVGGTPSYVMIPNNSKGFTIGDVPNGGFADGGLNIGDNTIVEGGGNIAAGISNSVAATSSIAVGNTCTVTGDNSMCLGLAATTVGFTAAPVLAMSDGTAKGNSFSTNTLVLDSGNQVGSTSAGIISTAGSDDTGAIINQGSAGRGNIYLETGTLYSGSADYAELFEWDDGNANSADRRGFFVSLTNGNKIEVGNSEVIGVISGRPVIVGDAATLGWHGRILLDEFGSPQQELRDGVLVPKYNPNYDSSQVYTPRIQRKEWSPVGLVGKLFVRSAKVLSAGAKCVSNSAGYAVPKPRLSSKQGYHVLRVMRQATTSKYGIVEILMK
jgi:hypothetical protein